MNNRWSELGKLVILCLTLALITVIGKVPPHISLILSFIHVLSLALAGLCFLMLTNLHKSQSVADTLVMSYGAGWATIPIFATVSLIGGHYAVIILLIIAGIFAGIAWWFRKKHSMELTNRHDEQEPLTIPLALYCTSFVYTMASVALPFSNFSFNSIAREFYSDGIHRFGTIYALAQNIPPSNPFFAGVHLMYYWFSFLPFAMEYRFLHIDLFNIWKSGQIWTSLLFLPFLWYVMAKLFNKKVVAWSVVLLGFFFASYEIFVNLYWVESVFSQYSDWKNLFGSLIKLGLSRDPDMMIGIITPYSDQLFMEDFLYIPHNTCALLVIFCGLWFLEEKRHWAAIFTFSSLAAINTFFIIPVFSALFVRFFIGFPLLAALLSFLLLGSYTLVWMVLCGIISYPSVLNSLFGAFVSTAVFVYFSRKNCFLAFKQKSGQSKILRMSTWSFLVSLVLLMFLRPRYNLIAYMLNYGPSFLIGLYFLYSVLFLKTDIAMDNNGAYALIFILITGAIYNLVTVFVYLQFLEYIPLPLRDLAYRFGLYVNLFNFYHKIGKLIRLNWAVLAGLALALSGPTFLNYLLKKRLLFFFTLLALSAAAITSLVRPLTYFIHGTVEEANAACYLLREKKNISTTLLLEDYSGSRINMLAPVSVFFYSSWSGGNPGLTHAIGTWADQYLPKYSRKDSKYRETLNQLFFSDSLGCNERKYFLREHSIDFILSRKKYDFYPFADLVVEKEGGFLYVVKQSIK